MTKTKIISTILIFLTTTLFAQTFNANFEVDNSGWTSRQSIERTTLFSQLEDRHGLSFSREYPSNDIILFIQKEITELKPNTNYRVMFNMNWLAWLDASALPIFIKIGAVNQEPTTEVIDLDNGEEVIVKHNYDKGEIGRNGRDFIVAGQLNPDKQSRPFLQNVHNLNNAFFVNTDNKGRLFLMIGIETENEIIENVFLTTVRVQLRENGEAREISNVEKKSNNIVEDTSSASVSGNDALTEIPEVLEGLEANAIDEIETTVVFIRSENDLVFFKSEYNNDIEMVNIYTQDNHLMKFFSFRNASVDRAFQTTGLEPGTYRIEFLLSDGRIINELFTIEK
jgi:hypothetical protein